MRTKTIAVLAGLGLFAFTCGCRPTTPVAMTNTADRPCIEAVDPDDRCKRCTALHPARVAMAEMTIEELVRVLPVAERAEIEPVAGATLDLAAIEHDCPMCRRHFHLDVGMDLPQVRLVKGRGDTYWIHFTEGYTGNVSWRGPSIIDEAGSVQPVPDASDVEPPQ